MPSPRFTKQNAAHFSRLGREAQARLRRERAERVAQAHNGEDFLSDTLAHTREAVTDTLQRLLAAKEPKDRELLARALAALAETERKLSGRPLPGTRRPGAAEPAAPRSPLPTPR